MWKAIRSSLIYRPIFNILLLFLLLFQGNLWLAIVALTILIRALLWNSTKQQAQMQAGGGGMWDMQEKLKEVQEKYKDQPDVLARETMKTMKSTGMWPLKGCLGMLIQLPIMIWLYRVIMNFSQNKIVSSDIYSFLAPFLTKFIDIQNISPYFLWLNLFDKNSIILTVVGWILIFAQTRLTTLMQSKNAKPQIAVWPGGQQLPDMQKMMWPMNIFMVFMMMSVIYSTQNWLGLYLVATTLVSVIQYSIQNRSLIKISWLTRSVDKNIIAKKL